MSGTSARCRQVSKAESLDAQSTTPLPQIDVHRAAFSRAKAAMEAATAALAAAEQRKSKLSEELTMLVMQSSGAQMRVRGGGYAGQGRRGCESLVCGVARRSTVEPFVHAAAG